jgi:drug/metabolite transporter superfamily protein YnfA
MAAPMADFALSLTMLAALALIAGAIVLWVKRGERRKALLMIVAALVALANVAIWSLPAPAPTGQRR